MAMVHFSGTLTGYTSGLERVKVDAPRVHELLAALAVRFPGLEQRLEGMAVAINGEIHNDAAYEPLAPDAEVYFVPKMAGG